MTSKKKVDSRVRTLIENAVKTQHRSLFVIVGDHGKDQVVNLHYVLTKAQIKSKPSALWCYKKELGFSTHRKKRMNQIKKQMARGLYDATSDDPFELFISSTNIRWCYYKDSKQILGNTYGMVVLQDFEALTPNLLARTIETVEGGGLVVLLLRTMNSLKQLYTMTMDVHSRFRTEAHADVVPRFNERFLLSLGGVENCLVVDDQLNILPVSRMAKHIVPVPGSLASGSGSGHARDSKELRLLKESLQESQPIGCLVDTARTLDQAKAVMNFVEAISEKTLRSTVALTASRGRGKSASLGIAIAAAVAYGYSNIFITSPSPENLSTVFDFIFKGFEQLKYKDHLDYEAVQSTNPDFHGAMVRINVFRDHRQTIQYIDPADADRLSQAELLVIDEAAAIPLPLVQKLLGNYLVFMSSTVNGYEGTGRSLSLKLIAQLRKNQHESTTPKNSSGGGKTVGTGRILREISLDIPIRYAQDDPIEQWMNNLLCLDSAKSSHRITTGIPHPTKCELFHVNRDALFSYHKVSEAFLQRMMSLYVSSHYKNTPDDLQLMCDAPAHELFVLLGPNAGAGGGLPDILCVLQICKEGQISRESVKAAMARGKAAAGDLIPWTISQQFLENDFATLSGARVVRIATHPDATGMGYGSHAIEMLAKYYQGEIVSVEDGDGSESAKEKAVSTKDANSSGDSLVGETIKPRKNLPPLLTPLDQRPPAQLHYLGVSFGITTKLFNFWSRANFVPVYMRQTANDLTGEHTCIMVRPLDCQDMDTAPDAGWVDHFSADFAKRVMYLLSSSFRTLHVELALSVINACNPALKRLGKPITGSEMSLFISPNDTMRLEAYAKNMADYRLITDMLPSIAKMYFLGQYDKSFRLSALQSAVLVGIGLQCHSIDAIARQVKLPGTQLLAMFNKAVRKVASYLKAFEEAEVAKELEPQLSKIHSKKNGSKKSKTPPSSTKTSKTPSSKMDGKDNASEAPIKDIPAEFQEYAIRGDDEEWEAALSKGQGKEGAPEKISLKRKLEECGGSTFSSPAPTKLEKHSSSKKKKDKSSKKKKKKKEGR